MAKASTSRKAASGASRSRSTEAQTDKAHKDALKASAEAKRDSAKTVGVDISDSDVEKARREGALEAEREAGKAAYKQATDGRLASESPPVRTFPGSDAHTNFVEPLLSTDLEPFIASIAEDAPVPLSEEIVANMLALERNGRNRTDYVKAMIKRLKLTRDDPLPGGGPGYTNDVAPVSDLYSD